MRLRDLRGMWRWRVVAQRRRRQGWGRGAWGPAQAADWLSEGQGDQVEAEPQPDGSIILRAAEERAAAG